jgi:hypothetical protein
VTSAQDRASTSSWRSPCGSILDGVKEGGGPGRRDQTREVTGSWLAENDETGSTGPERRG